MNKGKLYFATNIQRIRGESVW